MERVGECDLRNVQVGKCVQTGVLSCVCPFWALTASRQVAYALHWSLKMRADGSSIQGTRPGCPLFLKRTDEFTYEDIGNIAFKSLNLEINGVLMYIDVLVLRDGRNVRSV